jgi:hypothetical protein
MDELDSISPEILREYLLMQKVSPSLVTPGELARTVRSLSFVLRCGEISQCINSEDMCKIFAHFTLTCRALAGVGTESALAVLLHHFFAI